MTEPNEYEPLRSRNSGQPPTQPQPAWHQPPQPKRKRTTPLWATITIGAVALFVGVGIGGSGKTTTVSAATSTPLPARTVYVTVTAPAQAAPAATTAAKPPPATTTKAAPAAVTIPGDGTYAVGTDIKPGLYKTSGPAPGGIGDCYWERDKNLDGAFDSIIANGNTQGQTTVRVVTTDAAFKTTGCADWTKIG